uniref:Uncharacterized protein n=1 Tax=Geobacter sp. (strain M21) TaxID=443144 RepID=C6DZM8_GEOSM
MKDLPQMLCHLCRMNRLKGIKMYFAYMSHVFPKKIMPLELTESSYPVMKRFYLLLSA